MIEVEGTIGPISVPLELYARFFGAAAEDIEQGGTGTILLDRPGTGDEVGNGEWWVIKGKPWSCPCGASSPYMAESQSPHRIIVWPSEDDPNLVKCRERIRKEDGESSEAKPYERSMGAPVSFYALNPS